MLCTPKSA